MKDGKRILTAIRKLAGLLLAFVVVFPLCACGEGRTVVLTGGLRQDEVFRIGDASCSLPEVMVYLTNLQNQYEKIYGASIWEALPGREADGAEPESAEDGAEAENAAGKAERESAEDDAEPENAITPMEERLREQVLAELAQIKVMALLAGDRGVSLDQEEEDRVNAAAEEYYTSLNETEVSLLGVSQETLQGMYREYALAQKIYLQIAVTVNPEISDDQARTVTVQYVKTRDADTARKALNEASKEGSDFEAVADLYSESAEHTMSFGRGEVDEALEKAGFDLGRGELSGLVEAADGYYVLLCVSSYDEEQTKANKEKILARLREDAFDTAYESFAGTLVRQLNEELWDSVGLLRDDRVTTDSFFTVFDAYFEGKWA